MFSSFRLSSNESASTVDWGGVEYEARSREVGGVLVGGKRPSTSRLGERASKRARTRDWLRCYAQPVLLGRKIDANRKIAPEIERLPLEPHCYELVFDPYDPTRDPSEHVLPPLPVARTSGPVTPKTAAPPNPITPQTASKAPIATPPPSLPPVVNTPAAVPNGTPIIRRLVKSTHGKSPNSHPPIVTKAPETALVRLASGKLMRVPMEFLQRHQPQLLQAKRTVISSTAAAAASSVLPNGTLMTSTPNGAVIMTTSTTTTTTPNASTGMPGYSSAVRSNPPPNNTLSRVLERISPNPAVVRPTLPNTPLIHPSTPTTSRVLTVSTTSSFSSSASPSTTGTTTLPANVLSFLQQNGAALTAGGGSRVIRIKAYQSPTGANPVLLSGNGLQSSPQGVAKLSDRLNVITPVVSSIGGTLATVTMTPTNSMVTTLPATRHSYVLQPNSPVRLRTTTDSLALAKPIPISQLSQAQTQDGQRLSAALNHAVAGSGASVASPKDKVIVLGTPLQNGSAHQRPRVVGGSGLHVTPVMSESQKAMLAQNVAGSSTSPKTVLIKTANGLTQGNLVMSHPIQTLGPNSDANPASQFVLNQIRGGQKVLIQTSSANPLSKSVVFSSAGPSNLTLSLAAPTVIRSVAPGIVSLPNTPLTSPAHPVKVGGGPGVSPIIMGLGTNKQLGVVGLGGVSQVPQGVIKKQNEL
ncbi:hypothetical protein TCAL_10321 [Tigriopus californicus]|uniref:Uncharacterized protein n=1 Tax=Tigriopus californicus TaxID=6832 RepID=A0A553NCW2_TIGCA|nr:mucin-2-like [Tigriopus californicus]TRY63292.1 hypothetical protein TCAL_10321 [Tigriopus californicus]|eukprot:TCALIF_10321-PA protein Name:"Protein of unknown function" AED:0.00 eAED:0.00 QI:575/1/1/1/1/1/3/252/695